MNARRREREHYVEHVIAVLAPEFDWDETTVYVCRSQLEHAEFANGFPAWFEFICDELVAANWRLKSSPQDRKRLRVSYYGGTNSESAQARADALTRRLNTKVEP